MYMLILLPCGDLLLAEQADLVVYAGLLTILDEQVVDAFPGKMMNIHPALIPSFLRQGLLWAPCA